MSSTTLINSNFLSIPITAMRERQWIYFSSSINTFNHPSSFVCLVVKYSHENIPRYPFNKIIFSHPVRRSKTGPCSVLNYSYNYFTQDYEWRKRTILRRKGKLPELVSFLQLTTNYRGDAQHTHIVLNMQNSYADGKKDRNAGNTLWWRI